MSTKGLPPSMQSRELAAAVFSGLVLVAIAVYFGLANGQLSSEPDAEAMVGSSTLVQEQILNHGITGQAREQARRSLQDDLQRDMLELCWSKLQAIEPEPSTSVYQIQLAFSEAGREMGRSISQVREKPSRYDVAECLRTLPLGLTVDPLPQPLTFEFELHFGEGGLVLENSNP